MLKLKHPRDGALWQQWHIHQEPETQTGNADGVRCQETTQESQPENGLRGLQEKTLQDCQTEKCFRGFYLEGRKLYEP